jgi:RimJ/RimL family protein N-acetyltransferase
MANAVPFERPDPPLRGDGFVLRAWGRSDAERVVEACTDPETRRFLPILPQPYTHADAIAFIEGGERALADGTALHLAVADPGTDRLLGAITLHAPGPRHWYVGYWTVPDARGRGVTTGAVVALSRWAFVTHPDLVRLSLYTDPDNAASQRVAEKAGFRREGTLRRWDMNGPEPADVVMFSLVRSDLAERTATGG